MIEKLRFLKEKKHKEIEELHKIIIDLQKVNKIIDTIDLLKSEAGQYAIIGRSGKVFKKDILATVILNDIDGCIEVPKLIRVLAEEKKSRLMEDATRLLNKENRGVNYGNREN